MSLLHESLTIAIVSLSILLMLARPRHIPEAWWVGTGAALLVLLGLMPLLLADRAIANGFDVYLFLAGMMILSELARRYRVFDWLSSKAVLYARGSGARLFLLLYAVGILSTVFLSNDATAVVLTPAILAAVRKAKVPPMPHLFACAMVANAASFVLPISNPANLVVFQQRMPVLDRWLTSYTLPSILAIVTTFVVLRIYFRQDLKGRVAQTVEDVPLQRAGKLVLSGLGLVVAILIAASAFGRDLGFPLFAAALLVAGLISLIERDNPLALAKGLSWSTILLVAALFVLVAAVETLGILRYTQATLDWCGSLPPALGTTVAAFGVGVSNNLVNNLPLGLLAGATLKAAHLTGSLADAVLIGVDLGPNLSVTGSLATILWLLALRKERLDVSAWGFLKVGAIAMPLATLAAVIGLLVTHALIHR